MSQANQKHLAKFSGGSIRFVPAYTHMLGGNSNAGLMLSQLVYWHGMGKRYDNFFYKSVRELHYETGLTKNQQNNAARLLVSKHLINVKLAGIPATRTFWVDINKIEAMLTEWQKTIPLEMRKALFQLDGKRPTNTETTAKTTPQTISLDYDQSLPLSQEASNKGFALEYTKPILDMLQDPSRNVIEGGVTKHDGTDIIEI